MIPDTSLSFPMPVLDRSGRVLQSTIRDNRGVLDELQLTGAVEYRELPVWMERVFGNTCQGQIHPARVFGILLRLDELTPSNIDQLINPSRVAMGLKPYSIHWCDKVCAWCKKVSVAIRKHEMYSGADHMRPIYPEDRMTVSDQERKNIRLFRRCATPQEYEKYLNWLRKKYRTLERKRIKRELRKALKAAQQ